MKMDEEIKNMDKFIRIKKFVLDLVEKFTTSSAIGIVNTVPSKKIMVSSNGLQKWHYKECEKRHKNRHNNVSRSSRGCTADTYSKLRSNRLVQSADLFRKEVV